MTPLTQIIRQQIALGGPISVSEFMRLALAHPEHGYYIKRDPLGAEGDFTTAPEISQLFGEMIGAWLADMWVKAGSPEKFILLECGPGRGTLMADILRVTKNLPGFHAAANIHLLETSPSLRAKQKEVLKDFAPHWHDTLESVPKDAPLFVMANEFFDALPVRQLVFQGGRWCERVVGLNGEALGFGAGPAPAEALAFLPAAREAPEEGAVFEYSPSVRNIMQDVCGRIKKQGGVGLFIDYGHARAGFGETLQAVKAHRYSGVFENIGESDLTAHVDFEALAACAQKNALDIFGPIEQGAFLKALGIQARFDVLAQNADAHQTKELQGGLTRLTDAKDMGALFKVLAVCGAGITPEGFA